MSNESQETEKVEVRKAIHLDLHLKPIVDSTHYVEQPKPAGPAPRAEPVDESYYPKHNNCHSGSSWLGKASTVVLVALVLIVAAAVFGPIIQDQLLTTNDQQEGTITKTDDRIVPEEQIVPKDPIVVAPTATPTGQPYVRPQTTVENGIEYTGKSCNRVDGSIGREGYGPKGGLGCWKF